MLDRRRFLTIAAASLAAPAQAPPRMSGTALQWVPPRASCSPEHTKEKAESVFRKVEGTLRQFEQQFSLHRESESDAAQQKRLVAASRPMRSRRHAPLSIWFMLQPEVSSTRPCSRCGLRLPPGGESPAQPD